jgi:hypothetical protein
MLLLIAALTLFVAATADGLTTVRDLNRGSIEDDPILVSLYGSNTPSTLKIMLGGSAIILAEVAAAYFVNRHSRAAGHALAIAGFGQAAIHVFLAIRNWKRN